MPAFVAWTVVHEDLSAGWDFLRGEEPNPMLSSNAENLRSAVQESITSVRAVDESHVVPHSRGIDGLLPVE